MYFEHYGQPNEHGVVVIGWVMGRPLKCKFDNNLVYVADYNYNNEFGLAQRTIATCPNKEKPKNYKLEL